MADSPIEISRRVVHREGLDRQFNRASKRSESIGPTEKAEASTRMTTHATRPLNRSRQ